MVAIEKCFGGPTTSLQLLKKKAEKKKTVNNRRTSHVALDKLSTEANICQI